jgi:hypothetical protein
VVQKLIFAGNLLQSFESKLVIGINKILNGLFVPCGWGRFAGGAGCCWIVDFQRAKGKALSNEPVTEVAFRGLRF